MPQDAKTAPEFQISLQYLQELQYIAEECESLHMVLDEMEVPTQDERGEELSLVGRVLWFKYGCLPMA